MRISTKVEAFERELFVAGDAATLAAIAAQEIAAAERQNRNVLGRAIEHDTFVDGVEGAALAAVKTGGTIVAEFHLGTEVIAYVFDKVLAASPRRTGRFRASQRIYADGVEVDSPEAAAGAAEVVITSVVPYARKIERGQSQDAKDGVYESVALMASRRFGNLARIKFTFRSPLGGNNELARWAQRRLARSSKSASWHAKDTRQPAVVITFR
jgi:hypothetical protein